MALIFLDTFLQLIDGECYFRPFSFLVRAANFRGISKLETFCGNLQEFIGINLKLKTLKFQHCM